MLEQLFKSVQHLLDYVHGLRFWQFPLFLKVFLEVASVAVLRNDVKVVFSAQHVEESDNVWVIFIESLHDVDFLKQCLLGVLVVEVFFVDYLEGDGFFGFQVFSFVDRAIGAFADD